MTSDWSRKDFLNRQGGESKRHRLWGILGFSAVAVVLGVWLFGGDGDEEVVDDEPESTEVFAEAWSRVDAGLSIARDQLESGEAESLVQARAEQQAREAHFEEGVATTIAGELQPDQSVYLAMVGRDLPDGAIHQVVTAMEDEFDFRRSRAGDEWSVEVNDDGRIEEFRYSTSPEDIWVTRLDEDGKYVAEEKDVDIEVRTRSAAGTVDGSFWLSMSSLGESDLLALRFMEVFEYSIDFNVETRDGDHFAVIFEELYLDDEFLRGGRILAAKYIGMRGVRQAYFFEGEEEDGYYDEDGESLQRQFLRSPLSVTRVTSQFGRRQHPITGDERMHRGVDYGAPEGTPVQAVADGRVSFAGWRGGYGKLLIITHSGGYETRYAHLSGFNVSSGSRVSQGQQVAQSGNTGASTAPHLHYEMLRNGAHIDPLTVEATSGDPLRGDERSTYRQDVVGPLSEDLHEVMADHAPEALAEVADEEVDDDDQE